jgi:murein DD-endopeptidase MepM/ murein hydrolase activator NlpD
VEAAFFIPHNMNKKVLILVVVIGVILSVINRKMIQATASKILDRIKIRMDASGSGRFGSSRGGGSRLHNGVDLEVIKGQPVYAPFAGTITKQAYPYEDDRKYTGVHLTRKDGVKMKVFYMLPKPGIIGKAVSAGDEIGRAQDISEKYGAPMKPHIHVEVWRGTTLENPEEFFNIKA